MGALHDFSEVQRDCRPADSWLLSMLDSAAHPIWTLNRQEVIATLGSDERGLNDDAVQQRLLRFGPNALPAAPRRHLLLGLADQMVHPMALLLWIAGGLALLAQTPQLATAIWAVVLINGLFSFWQEYQAERTMAALLKALPHQVQLWRNGVVVMLPATEVVPGDLLVLEEGDQVPADGRLIEAHGLYLDLSLLTGESLPVARHARALQQTQLATGERANLVLAGTTVAAGRGLAVVYASGGDTEFGHVARLSAQTRRSPSTLEQQVGQIVRTITVIAVGLGLVIFALSLTLVGMGAQESLIYAIGLIVANVPEGLLPTVTLALAINVQRMARRQALVRRLSAVETLGSVSVICSDKTGTLTEGRMQLREIWMPHDSAEQRRDLLRWATLCSNARLEHEPSGHEPWRAIGDTTETALLLAAVAADLSPAQIQHSNPRLHEVPFDSQRRRMSVVVNSNGGPLLICKGAPREVLGPCTALQTGGNALGLNEAERSRLLSQSERLAAQGLRVLALAIRPLEAGWQNNGSSGLEQELAFVGFVGLEDPPRHEVPAAISACHGAGIKVIMVTGDSGRTAEAIARQIGLLDAASEPVRVIEGEALDQLSAVQLRQLIKFRRRLVFARMTPEQKLRLVQAYRQAGDVVAVTGDGVNDAPALRAADVGIAMGRSGTDVAREAADVVLLDDNFATIATAIRHGRGVVANIQRFITYVIASNVAEMMPFVAMVGLQIPAALTVLQILAVDLGTDLLPALGLGAEPPEAGVMRQPPRPRGQALLDRAVLVRAYLVLGLSEALVAMGGFALVWAHNGLGLKDLQRLAPQLLHHSADPALMALARQASTLTFVLIVAGQMGVLLACRSRDQPFWQRLRVPNKLLWAGLLSEPLITALLVLVMPLAQAFGMTRLPLAWLGWVGLAPLAVLAVDTLHKQLRQRHRPAHA